MSGAHYFALFSLWKFFQSARHEPKRIAIHS
jgi:hypothetical protein